MSSLQDKLHCSHCGRDNHKKKDCKYLGQKKCTDCDRFHKGDKCWIPQASGNKRPWKGKEKEGEFSNKRQKQSHSAKESAKANNASIHGAFVSLLAVSVIETNNANTVEDENIKIYHCKKDSKDSNNVDIACSSVTSSPKMSENEDLFEWIADSASTVHITNQHNAFASYNPVPDIKVTGVGRVQAFAVGKGTVYLKSECNGKTNILHLNNILYIPCNQNNLLSVICWERAPGCSSHFEDQEVILNLNKNTMVARGHRKDSKLYKIRFAIAPASHPDKTKDIITDLICLNTQLLIPWETWHR